MSMWAPMEPNLGRGDDGIPAADPGAGAPEPADGFGIGGEEPDQPEDAAPEDAAAGDGALEDGAPQPADTPFRTPDPEDVARG